MSTHEPETADDEGRQMTIEDITAEHDIDGDRERVQQMLDRKQIGAAQNNVAMQDLKAGKRLDCLPYLYVNRELPLDLVQEASRWYDGQRSDKYQTAIFLLNCDGITAKKMEAARKYLDSLPPKRDIANLIATMEDEEFEKYLVEYKFSRDPVALSRKIASMQGSLEQMKGMIEKMVPAVKKEEGTAAEKPGMQKSGQTGAENAEKVNEESAARSLEMQQAAMDRIEKMYQEKHINEAQMRLANFHIISGMAIEDLPYLTHNSFLTVSMIDDVVKCMKAGMDHDVLSAVLQQPNITSSKLQIIYEFIPHLPGREELLTYLSEAESDEALKNALTEYKNRNDIEWVRRQLKEKETTLRDKETALQEMGTRLKAVEDEMRLLKEKDGPAEMTETAPVADGNNTAEIHSHDTDDESGPKSNETSVPENESGQESKTGREEGESNASESSPESETTNEEGKAGLEETEAEETESAASEDSPGQGEAEEEEEKAKTPSFFERFLPGFYHAERKEYVENRWKSRERKKKERELRAELQRTVNDMYAQDVIDDEAFYIFADIAFKGQKMDKRVATFMVQELHNGVPFALLCKVVKNVKNSGDWSSCAMVLRELIQCQSPHS